MTPYWSSSQKSWIAMETWVLFLPSTPWREEHVFSGCCVLKYHLLVLLQWSEELGITVVVTKFFGLEDVAWPPVKGHQKCRALYNNLFIFLLVINQDTMNFSRTVFIWREFASFYRFYCFLCIELEFRSKLLMHGYCKLLPIFLHNCFLN